MLSLWAGNKNSWSHGAPWYSADIPHFVLIKDRLFWLSCDTCTEEEYTQLLVPNSRQEMIFPAAHYNAWQGLWDVGYEKILE